MDAIVVIMKTYIKFVLVVNLLVFISNYLVVNSYFDFNASINILSFQFHP